VRSRTDLRARAAPPPPPQCASRGDRGRHAWASTFATVDDVAREDGDRGSCGNTERDLIHWILERWRAFVVVFVTRDAVRAWRVRAWCEG
jgi:hypothetical protein